LFGKHSRLVQLANTEQTATVGVIQPPAVVRDLGVLFDQGLGMTRQIMAASCFYQLRTETPSSCRPGALVLPVVHQFVLAWLDYDNSALADLPKTAWLSTQRIVTIMLINLRYCLLINIIIIIICLPYRRQQSCL